MLNSQYLLLGRGKKLIIMVSRLASLHCWTWTYAELERDNRMEWGEPLSFGCHYLSADIEKFVSILCSNKCGCFSSFAVSCSPPCSNLGNHWFMSSTNSSKLPWQWHLLVLAPRLEIINSHVEWIRYLHDSIIKQFSQAGKSSVKYWRIDCFWGFALFTLVCAVSPRQVNNGTCILSPERVSTWYIKCMTLSHGHLPS